MAIFTLWSAIIATVEGGFPEGPNQQCRDDAGPPWVDDGDVAYYVGWPNRPILPASGECPAPLAGACETKTKLAAYMDGPIDCGGKGWFCRIFNTDYHEAPGGFADSNYASCNQADTNHDRDGHCHGSDVEDTYGWWVRDHWHRNYAGKVKCCCDWEGGTVGVVNRCDYRKHVTPEVLETCRDANEEHEVDWHPDCQPIHAQNYKEPDANTCWEIDYFAPGPYEDGPPENLPPTPQPMTPTPQPPSPPPREPTNTEYLVADSGMCPFGYSHILDEDRCNELAVDQAKSMSVTGRVDRPAGCYYFNEKFFFGEAGDFGISEGRRQAVCKEGSPPTTKLMSMGACDPGYKHITTPLECTYASFRLELSYTPSQEFTREDRPAGCYIRSNKLWFNHGGLSSTTDTSRRSICVKMHL